MKSVAQVWKYIPKSKTEAIEEIEIDWDGSAWIYLKEGWNADRMDDYCHTIHEKTVADLKFQIAGIKPCKDIPGNTRP